MSNRETEFKKLEKQFKKLKKEFINTQNLIKHEKNHKTKEKLAQKTLNIYNTMKEINIKAKAIKEREAFKRKANSGFNTPQSTPPRKKSAKK